MAAAGAAGPPPPLRASACLLIDGQHMRLALDSAGNPPFLPVVRALEEAFRCAFVRKEWHEGTPDGRPAPFHLELSAPEAGHVTPRIRQMKLCAGLAVTPDGQTTPHRVAIRIQKGVDVALALAMTQPRTASPLLFDEYDTVVVVTGDGDLEAAIEASAALRRTHVCGLREGIAPVLRRWVKSEGDRGLYLKDILARAWATAFEGSSSHNANPTLHHLIGHAALTPASASASASASGSGSPAPVAGHAADTSSSHHHRTSPPPPGLGLRPTTPAAGSWLAAALNEGAHRPSPSSSSSSSSAATSPSSRERGAAAEEMLLQPSIGSSRASAASSLASSVSSAGQQQAPIARTGSPEAVGSALLLKAPGGPSFSSSSTYASRLLLGASTSGSGSGKGGSSSADSSPALTALTPSLGRSPGQQRDDDEGGVGSSAGANGGRSGESRSRRRKSAKLRLKCFAGPLCTKLKEEEHLRRTTHPCHAGGRCPVLLGPDSPEKALHMERFLHPCPRGAACEVETPEHTACFEHVGRGLLPLCTKKGCRGGDKADHAAPHRHLCPHGRNCSFLSHSVADKRVIRHTASFLHPCPWGARCVAARAPQWNWEHMQSFVHAGPEAAGGPMGGGSKADEMAAAAGAEEAMQRLLMQLQQQQQQQQQQQLQQPPQPHAGGGGDGFGASSSSSSSSSSYATLFASLNGSGGGGGGGMLGSSLALTPPGAISEEGREDASSSFDETVAGHEEEDQCYGAGAEAEEGGASACHHHQHDHHGSGHGHGHGPAPGLLGSGAHEPQPHAEEEDKGVGGGGGHDALLHLAAFKRQFLASSAFAAADVDPYRSIFRPSQHELAAMPLGMGAATSGGAGSSGFQHQQHQHQHHAGAGGF